MAEPPPRALTDVRELGRRPYEPVWEEMRRLREERRQGRIPDTLLLVEHEPVITVGVQGAGDDGLPGDLPVLHVERGGRSTYHGPGQWVGYPIVDLTPRGRDIRRFVGELEELMVRAVRPFGVDAGRVEGKRGVWVDGVRKIGSVGIAVEAWTTYHGFALNVATDLSVFERFHPCGFEGKVMTSLSRELGRPVRLTEVRPGILAAWHDLFG